MEEDNKNAGNNNNSSKQNCVIIGKLVLSFDQLNELIPLIVTNIVNDLNLMVNDKKVSIEIEMQPLKSMKQKYRSNIAFVFERSSDILQKNLNILVNHDSDEIYNNESVDCLKNAFSISWMILELCQKIEKKEETTYSGVRERDHNFSMQTDAEVLQWNQFANSEVGPFINGLLSNLGQNRTRDVMFANRLRNERLKKSLNVLNRTFEKRPCLVGKNLTLADISLAAQLMPLLDQDMVTICPNIKDLQDQLLNKDYTFLKKWFENIVSLVPVKDAIDTFKKIKDENHISKEDGDVLSNDAKKSASFKGANNKSKPSKQNKKEKSSNATKQSNKLKILCIHGYRQNEKMFREKTGAFRKIVGKYADLVFITAPHFVKPIDEEDPNQDQRGWWFSRENDYFKADDVSDCDKGFQASLDILAEGVRLHGPFHGVIGFSQGSALTALIILRAAIQKLKDRSINVDEKINCRFNDMEVHFPEELLKFEFGILFSGFRSHSSRHSPIYEMIESVQNSSNPKALEEALVPTLHIIGKDDKVIGTDMSEELFSLFRPGKSQSLYHEGGHFVPAGNKTEKPAYIDFLSKMKECCFNDE